MSERVELTDEILEIIQDPDGYMRRKYGEKIEKYQQVGKIGKLLIARRYPDVANYVAYIEAQQSIVDAQRSAYANEGRQIVL